MYEDQFNLYQKLHPDIFACAHKIKEHLFNKTDGGKLH